MLKKTWVPTESFIRFFARLTIGLAVIHLALETFYTFRFGQSFVGYLPDYVSVALMIFGGRLALQNINATGVLCGAWGFALCLHYRGWAWRFEAGYHGLPLQEGQAMVEALLGASMLISLLCFLVALVLCVSAGSTSQ